MINVIENGNIFDSQCKYITNAVNCIGVMGAGIAKQFAEKYPSMYEEYKRMCKLKLYEIGKPRIQQCDGKYIVNFPTMYMPGSKAKLSDITKGLEYLKDRLYRDFEHDCQPLSIAICALGCGIGGLNSNEVLSEIKKVFTDVNWVDIDFYQPSNS